jgi:hypothetical protein
LPRAFRLLSFWSRRACAVLKDRAAETYAYRRARAAGHRLA